MCNTQSHIKLCTCKEGEIDQKLMWILFRGEMKNNIVGSFLPRKSPERNDALSASLLEDLNKFQVFDFDCAPRPSDQLLIRIESEEFYFRFTFSDGWIASDLSPTPYYKKAFDGHIFRVEK